MDTNSKQVYTEDFFNLVLMQFQGCHQTTQLKFSDFSVTLTVPWPKLTTTLLYLVIFYNYNTWNICAFCYNVSLCTIIFGHFIWILQMCPPFLVCALYIHKHAWMCRLFWILNSIKGCKTLNLPSIPTWKNILLNLIWENKVTPETETLGNHKY